MYTRYLIPIALSILVLPALSCDAGGPETLGARAGQAAGAVAELQQESSDHTSLVEQATTAEQARAAHADYVKATRAQMDTLEEKLSSIDACVELVDEAMVQRTRLWNDLVDAREVVQQYEDAAVTTNTLSDWEDKASAQEDWLTRELEQLQDKLEAISDVNQGRSCGGRIEDLGISVGGELPSPDLGG